MNICFILILISGIVALLLKNPELVISTMLDGATSAIELCLQLLAIYCVWLSLLEMMDRTKISASLAKGFRPITKRLFKNENDKAYEYITMSLATNMIGLGSAATPLAIRAMELMQDGSTKATRNMIMLMVIGATSIQLLPATIIAMRANYNSISPSDIIFPSLLSTAITTATGILLTYVFVKEKKK